jgi:hypothetical protein
MASYLGDFNTGQTVHFTWDQNNGAGASVTPSVAGTVSVYKNNGTTQSTAGVTDTRTFDSLTGIAACTIDLSSDGTFYSAGANFSVVLSAATIDGQSVNATLAHFSIENRNIKANVTQYGGTNGTFAGGRPEVNTTHIAGSAVSTASAQIGVNVVNAGGTAWGSGAITAASIASAALAAAKFAADTGLVPARSGTAQAGAGGSVTLDAGASAVDSFYVGMLVLLTGATGAGQARVVTAYVGATKVASIAPNWATNPDNTTTFAVLATGQVTGVQGNVTGTVASVIGAVGSVTGNVGGNVVGSVASVAGNVAGNVTGTIGDLAAAAQTTVKAQVTAVLRTDTDAELAAVPAAASSIAARLGWLFLLGRNKLTQTATTQLARNDGDSATVGTSTDSDDGTTAVRGKWA